MPAPAPSQLKRLNAKRRGSNTYRFQGFNERIHSIQLNLHHTSALLPDASSSLTSADLSSSQSHFLSELQRQADLDHTAAFTAVVRQLRPLSRSFALVVHNKHRIHRILIHALTHADEAPLPATSSSSSPSTPLPSISSSVSSSPASPAPFLSLLTTLARDLRYDFYPLFPLTFTSLLSTLNPAHPEQLHLLFSSLLFLFKFLQRHLVNDLPTLHRRYFQRLLRHPRWYIRRFAGESLAYLVRKVKPDRRAEVYRALLALPEDEVGEERREEKEEVEEEEREVRRLLRVKAMRMNEYRDGIAALLFHTHKGVGHAFHSLTPASLSLLLAFLSPPPHSPQSPLSRHHYSILTTLFRRLANHTRQAQSTVIWTALSHHLQLTLDRLSKAEEGARESAEVELTRVVELLSTWTGFRQGSRIADAVQVIRMIEAVAQPELLAGAGQGLQKAVVGLVASFAHVKAWQAHSHQLHAVLAAVFSPSSGLSASVMVELVGRLQAVGELHSLLLRWTFAWVERLVTDATREAERQAWLTVLLVVCQPYRQHDGFYYAERTREAEDALLSLPLPPSQKLQSSMPRKVTTQLLHIVVDSLSLSAFDEGKAMELYGALQLLSMSAVTRLDGVLSTEQAEAVHMMLEGKLGQEEEEEDDDEMEDGLTVHHLLLAFSLHAAKLARVMPHPTSHPPLPLLSRNPASPTTSPVITPTSSIIDRLLHLSTRSLVTSHLLLSTTSSFPSSLLRASHTHLIDLLTFYGPHPAVLRSLLSLLHTSQFPSSSSSPSSSLSRLLSPANCDAMIRRLTPALAHPGVTVRSLSLHILSLYPFPPTPSPTAPLLPLLLSLTSLSPSLPNERTLTSHLSSLLTLISSHHLPPSPYPSLLLSFLLGLLHVKMSSLWLPVQRCLAALLAGYEGEVQEGWVEGMRRSGEETRVLVSEEEEGAMRGEEEGEEEEQVGEGEAENGGQEVVLPGVEEEEGEADAPEDAAMDEGELEGKEAEEEEAEEEEEQVERLHRDAPPVLTLPSTFSLFCHFTARSTDVYTYHALLQKTLTLDDAKPFADRHSFALSSLFLTFYFTQYQLVYPAQDHILPPSSLPTLLSPSPSSSPSTSPLHPIPLARKVAKVKLLHFLRLFDASFTLSHLSTLRSFFPAFLFRLLVHPDAEVQGLALKGLAKWGWAWMKPYTAHLQKLVGDGWREEMTVWHLHTDVSPIERTHRPPLTAVITRIVYPRLMQTKAQRGKATVSQRRAAILAWLAGLQHEEMSGLIAIMLAPFMHTLRAAAGMEEEERMEEEGTGKVKGKKEKREEDEAVILRECFAALPAVSVDHLAAAIERGARDADGADVDLAKQVGLLRLLETLLSQMRSVLQGYLPHFLIVLLAMLKRANDRIDEYRRAQAGEEEPLIGEERDEQEGDEEEEAAGGPSEEVDEKREQKQLRSIRQLVFSRMASILELYHASFFPSPLPAPVDLTPFLSHFLTLASPSIALLPIEQTQHKGALLSALLTLSLHPTLVPVLAQSPTLLPAVFSLLSAPKASPDVIKTVLSLCENLLAREDDARRAEEEEQAQSEQRKRPKKPRPSAARMLDSSDEEAEKEERDEEAGASRNRESGDRSRQQAKRLAGVVQAAWRAHISCFLHHVHAYLSSSFSSTYYPRRELSIIARVAGYASEPASAQALTSLLLPFLSHLSKAKAREWKAERVEDAKMRSKESVQHSLLSILHSTVPLHPAPASLVPFLSRQFLLIHSNANRTLLTRIFTLLATRIPSLTPVASLLSSLTAINAARLDEPDYDAIVTAYTAYTAHVTDWSVEQHTPVLYLALHQVGWEELAVRGQASQALKAFADVRGSEVEAAVMGIIFPAIKRGVKHGDDKIRREWVLLLHHLVVTYPLLFPAYQPLVHANPDLDFFLSITHLQAHRKQRALARLHPLLPPPTPQPSNSTSPSPNLSPSPGPTGPLLPPSVLTDLILPLLHHFLFSSGGQGLSTLPYSSLTPHQRDRMRRSNNNTQGADHGLVEEAVATVGVVARGLPWSLWVGLLQGFVRQVKVRPELERLLVRVICGVVEAWHFDVLGGERMSEEEKAKEVETIDRAPRPQQRSVKGRTAKKPSQPAPASSPAAEEAKTDQAAGEADEAEDAVVIEAADAFVEVVEEEEEEEEEGVAAEDAMEVEESDAVVSVPSAQRARTLALKVRHVLSTSLLPHLLSLLTGTNRGDALSLLRPSVALAIVHLLLRVPSDFFQLHFPRLLTSLLSHLCRREQDARDVARKVLVDVVVAIGSSHLSRMVTEAKQMLRRGYQVHVLGYLVWAVLDRLVKEKEGVDVAGVDAAVETVMSLVMEELVGEVGREKEVEAIRRAAKEVRAAKALDVVECLAELSSFEAVKAVVKPMVDLLLSSVRSEEVKQMKEGLRRVGEGLMRNRSVDVKDVLVFVYATVNDAMQTGAPPKRKKAAAAADDDDDEEDEELTEKERTQRMRRSKEATLTVQLTKSRAVTTAAPSSNHNLPVVVHFALSLLHAALKHHKLPESDATIRALLDPYLPLLASTTTLLAPSTPQRSSALSVDVLDVSLKVTNFLLRFPSLPSLPSFITRFSPFLFTLLTSSESALLPSLFKTLSILIQHSRYPFTQPQLSLLFSFIKQELLAPSDHSFVFPLLHSVLTRKLLHPDLYDAIDRTAQLMVTSPSALIRTSAASLFLLFLLDYPVGAKRMQHHLTFLITNLAYPVASGRLQVLTMLESVVVRFPQRVLEEVLEVLMLPLLCALMNEEEEEGRERVGKVMTRLVGRVGVEKQRTVARWVEQWMEKDEEGEVETTRRCGAMQCYGFMVEGMGEAIHRFVPAMMAQVRGVVAEEERRQQSAIRRGRRGVVAKEEKEEGGDGDGVEEEVGEEAVERVKEVGGEEGSTLDSQSGDWRLLYFTLITLEKALKQPGPVVKAFLPHVDPSSQASLYPTLVSFMLHPHTWIRSVATRITAALLAAAPALSSAQTLRLMKVSCMQLDSERLQEKLAQHAVNNLIQLAAYSLTIGWDDIAAAKAEPDDADVEGEVDDIEVEAKESITSTATSSRPSLASLHALVDQRQKNRGLNWAFHRLSYMSRQPGHVKRTAILSFFRHVIRELAVAVYLPYLLPLLHSLFRLANQADYNEQSAEVKAAAAVLMEELQQKAGSGVFLPYYNAVRGGVMDVRRERREKRKVMAVVAPAAFARRKQEKHGRKKLSRKRKMEGVKLAKGIAGVFRIERQRSQESAQAGQKRRKTA